MPSRGRRSIGDVRWTQQTCPFDHSRIALAVPTLPALFELPSDDDPISDGTASPTSLDDPALQEALQHHGLAWFDDTAG
jgi:hypothetical protein